MYVFIQVYMIQDENKGAICDQHWSENVISSNAGSISAKKSGTLPAVTTRQSSTHICAPKADH